MKRVALFNIQGDVLMEESALSELVRYSSKDPANLAIF